MSALLLALALLAGAPGAGSPELEPYRALARDRAAAEALLAAAREGLASAVGEEAAAAGRDAGGPDRHEAPGATVPPARRAAVASASGAPAWPGSPRPLYVTLARGRATRACVGADAPPAGSLAESLRLLGARLATHDRRRPPVLSGELDTLRLVVAFAGDPVPVAEPMSVDPVREGLKIETDRGAIAFLPGEARTVQWALREARRVGVLAGPLAEARCSRFDVVTLQGPARAAPVLRKEPNP